LYHDSGHNVKFFLNLFYPSFIRHIESVGKMTDSCGMALASSIQKMSVVVFGMFVAMLGDLSIGRGVAES